MRTRQWLGVLAMAAALSFSTAVSASGAPQVAIKDDKFSAQVLFTGPQGFINPFGGTSRNWFIRSWLNKSDHTATHQLYVATSYLGHWRFWDIAADDHAGSHPVVIIDRTVEDCSGMCSYDETVGVDLDDAFLRANSASGFQIKLTAKSGDELILTVSPDQIQPLLAAIDGYGKPPSRPPGAPADAAAPFGVKAQDRPGVLRMLSSCPGTKGAFLLKVIPGGVADRGGLQETDTITSLGDVPISGKADLEAALKTMRAGQLVSIGVSTSACDVRTASVAF
jgi:PDZ domain